MKKAHAIARQIAQMATARPTAYVVSRSLAAGQTAVKEAQPSPQAGCAWSYHGSGRKCAIELA